MSKKSLTNGVTLKVESRSGFDKSFFNALTTGVGTITPLVSSLLIPNSDVNMRLKISAQLPPLATDAFLRSHLKVEAFFTPLRLCYGGFESWFCGKEVFSYDNTFKTAKLPVLNLIDYLDLGTDVGESADDVISYIKPFYGAGSLLDYLGCFVKIDKANTTCKVDSNASTTGMRFKDASDPDTDVHNPHVANINIFPFVCYALVYDEYYRNKLVERPLFAPPEARPKAGGEFTTATERLYNLPYVCFTEFTSFDYGWKEYSDHAITPIAHRSTDVGFGEDQLLNGYLSDLRQRNYGDDYFTAATPSAQQGNPVKVDVISNKFSIQSLRLANAMQEFAEVNNFASPDYIQTLSARYGASMKAGIAQKPIFLGSADFPIYTSGVEQTAQGANQSVNNPFDTVGARYGRAHAEGSDFVCNFHVDEPGYFQVMVTLVPEAQYYQGIKQDLLRLNGSFGGSISDLPCALLENIGNEAIWSNELLSNDAQIFGYVQRYLSHKLGDKNQVHGLFRKDESLGSFVIQRDFASTPQISSAFLKIKKTDLDNVAAVSSGVSGFGVMIDSAVDMFVSEPLSESAIPSLVDPAKEHGRSVYIKTGGSKLD